MKYNYETPCSNKLITSRTPRRDTNESKPLIGKLSNLSNTILKKITFNSNYNPTLSLRSYENEDNKDNEFDKFDCGNNNYSIVGFKVNPQKQYTYIIKDSNGVEQEVDSNTAFKICPRYFPRNINYKHHFEEIYGDIYEQYSSMSYNQKDKLNVYYEIVKNLITNSKYHLPRDILESYIITLGNRMGILPFYVEELTDELNKNRKTDENGVVWYSDDIISWLKNKRRNISGGTRKPKKSLSKKKRRTKRSKKPYTRKAK